MNLQTPRLNIRPLTLDDVEPLEVICADPEVMRYLGPPMSPEAVHAYVVDCMNRQTATGISRYAVVRRSNGELLGYCGFKQLAGEDAGGQLPRGSQWTDFGWRYRRSAWRQGYGSEAALAIRDNGRRLLTLPPVEARAHRDNVASLRIIEKLGFVWVNDYQTPLGSHRRYREPPV